MSLFVNLDELDSYTLLAAAITRSRLAMRQAFNAAFKAYDAAIDLLNHHRYESARYDRGMRSTVDLTYALAEPRTSRDNLERLYARAVAEDRQADYQAGPVLLFADDVLQRFARGVLGEAPGLSLPGFGPEYGSHLGKVKLTRLLRAGTNALRHVSEWDDKGMPFPYPPLDGLSKRSKWRRPMESIELLQQVFGIGRSERIRDPASMRVLIAVDGQLETSKPDYCRFEAAVLDAAHEIAACVGSAGTKRLQDALPKRLR